MTNSAYLRACSIVFGLAVGACGYDNAYYCPNAPNQNCFALDAAKTIDAPPPGCTSDQSCSGSAAVCVIPTATCVQCTSSEHAACVATTPTCGSDDTCHGCVAHTDCASDACLPDGSCGDDTTVAYVDPAGTNNTMCTRAMPCTAVAKALATSRPFVKFHGTTDEAVALASGAITFLADPAAELTRSSGNGPILSISGTGTSLAVYDLTISNAPNNASGYGVLVPTGGGSPTVSLARVTISNNPGGGISSAGGNLTVLQSTISGNAGVGISATAGSLTVSRSTIANNGTGTGNSNGITVNGATFSITNNFIHHNGNSTATTLGGGVSLAPSGSNTFSYNTVVDNAADLGAASAGGVFCDTPGFVAAHNLIYRNTGGTSTTAQTFGSCTYDDSMVMTATAGTNALAFASPNLAPFDYHLTASSPATVVNAADACSVPVDFDGDARPQGPACDLGADEFKP